MVDAIRSWAAAHQLTVGSLAANRLLVSVSGSSQQIGEALGTGFENFQSQADGSFFAATQPATLPQSFGSAVTAVLGLSSLGKVAVPQPPMRSSSALSQGKSAAAAALSSAGLSLPSLNYPAQYTPQNFWSMYDAPSSETGSGQQVSIITEGDLSQPQADLATFEKTLWPPGRDLEPDRCRRSIHRHLGR